MNRSTCQRGFTLIETLTVIGVLGIIAGLLMPAIQAAREATRRSQCANNLHQLGLAMGSYHAAFNSFPLATSLNSTAYGGYYSQHVRMLQFLDQASLYNSVNFTIGTFPPDTFLWPALTTAESASNTANATVVTTHVGIFVCPSDGGALLHHGNNYRGNVGIGPRWAMNAETPDSGTGVFPELGTISAARIPDGMSHTCAFSERLRGSDRANAPIPSRDLYKLPIGVFTADQLLNGCRLASISPATSPVFVNSGRWWFWSGRERVLYNHTQTPNGPIIDCAFGGSRPASDMATARSWHPGGVNGLMADGSLRFVSSSISLNVWRGLGTRNGHELVD